MLEQLLRIGDKETVRKWAYRNAYTLILLAILFGITWLLLLAQAYGWIGQ